MDTENSLNAPSKVFPRNQNTVSIVQSTYICTTLSIVIAIIRLLASDPHHYSAVIYNVVRTYIGLMVTCAMFTKLICNDRRQFLQIRGSFALNFQLSRRHILF